MRKLIAALMFVPALAAAQGTPADYARAKGLRARYEALALNVPGTATWSKDSSQFWYRRTVKGGHEFVAFDVATRQSRPPFDHARAWPPPCRPQSDVASVRYRFPSIRSRSLTSRRRSTSRSKVRPGAAR
jgi:hypothetical protein